MTQHFRGIILRSMARTLWVTAYMDEVEERAGGTGDSQLADSLTEEERQKARDAMAKGGQDWMDVTPETPAAAAGMAAELCAKIEKSNSRSVEDGFVVALVADLQHERRKPNNECPDDAADELANTFGHYLVMEALGHGVSWEDDHAEQPLKLPDFENFSLRDEVRL